MSTPEPGLPNPYAPPTAPVSDIPPAGLPAVPAGRLTRLGAFLLDLAVAVVIYLPPLVVGAMHWRPEIPMLQNFANGGLAVSAILGIVVLVVTIVLVSRNGQTIGKRIVGIKVVRSNGTKAYLGRIFWLRNVVNGVLGSVLGGILAAALTFGGVGSIWPALSGYIYYLLDNGFILGAERRCVHDMIADTIVVRA